MSRYLPIPLLALVVAAPCGADEITQLKQQTRQLQHETAELQASTEADKARMQRLQKMIEELRQRNQKLDQARHEAVKEYSIGSTGGDN